MTKGCQNVSRWLGEVRILAINLPEIELIDREDYMSLLRESTLVVCVRTTTVKYSELRGVCKGKLWYFLKAFCLRFCSMQRHSIEIKDIHPSHNYNDAETFISENMPY